MDGLEETIGKILNDPGSMAQIMSLAQSLGLGGPPPAKENAAPVSGGMPQNAPPAAPQANTPPLFNQETISQVLRTLTTAGALNEKHAALFRALRPYLSEHKQAKLDRAMQLARLSQVAGLALRQIDPNS